MTDEEKRAMIQFFGTVHAQAKQTDQMVVGSSSHLRPISRDIQGQLEQVLHSPTNNNIQPAPVYTQPPPEVVPPIFNAAPQLTVENTPSVNMNVTHNTHDILVSINNSLEKIATILDNYCNAPKKNKNTKQI